jgi:DNA-directed RNA polymerase sigma subunit (sigma70/sigma32)
MSDETQIFLTALADLETALTRSDDMNERMRARIRYLETELGSGRRLSEIVPYEESPLLVQLLTESANLLHTYGTRVRRSEALALHREGVTMDQIAQLFGVTRQRVSALLRDSNESSK